MATIEVDNPLKWLLGQLPAYVPAEQLAELLERFKAHKVVYYRLVKIRELERKIKYRRSLNLSGASRVRLQTLEAQLARLKAAQDGHDG